MATLARPGVSVVQEVTPASPTIATPTLVSCVVGPCYAIVSPTDTSGAANGDAQVSTPARLTSDATLGTTVAIASKYIGIAVDDNDVVVAQMPAVATGSNLSTAAVPQFIQTRVPGVSVSLVGNKIVITSSTTGDASRLRLYSLVELQTLNLLGGSDTVVNALLNLDQYEDTDVFGKGSYDGSGYVLPYEFFPTYSFHPDATELAVNGDDSDLYVQFNGSMRKLSTNSAINWTSKINGDTVVNTTAWTQKSPFTQFDATLYAKKSGGSTTSRLFNAGQEASVVIPLSRDIPAGSPLTGYNPDPTGTFYLRAEALGAQDFLVDQTASVGIRAGYLGNELAVEFIAGGALTIVFGEPKLTITYQAVATTYADLDAAIAAAWAAEIAPRFYAFDLVYPAAMSAQKIDSASALHTKIWYLSGGINPVSFVDSLAAADEAATVLGAMQVSSGIDPITLLQGKALTISLNGSDPVTIPMPTAPQTIAELVTGINAEFPAMASLVALKSFHAESTVVVGNALQLVAPSAPDGTDSTIVLGGDPEVIELLFSGFTTKTETLAPGIAGNVSATLAAGTDYNKRSITNLCKAVVPGSVTLTLSDITMRAHFISGGHGATAFTNGITAISMTHSALNAGAAFTLTLDPAPGADTPAAFVAAINNELVALGGAYATTIIAVEITNPTTNDNHLCIYDATGTGTLTLNTLNTTADFKTDFEGIGPDQVLSFDEARTSQTVVVTVTDDSGVVKSPMKAVPSLNTWTRPVGFYYMNDSADPSTSFVEYSKLTTSGAITCHLIFELFRAGGAWGKTITYTRVAANDATLAVLDYTSYAFTGQPAAVTVGDSLWRNGAAVGTVVAVGEDLSATGAPTGWGTDAVLTLSSAVVPNGAAYTDWYIWAKNLPETGGRIAPEVVFNDITQEATIKSAVNRGFDGLPVTGEALVYAGYKALRLDVTAQASNPGLLVFENADQVEEQIGPLSTENPLAFALYLSFLNAPTVALTALGVGEVSANSPDGTLDAYQEALELLEQHEVYAMAPLTHESSVHQLANTHVTAMSAAEGKKERIVFVCPPLPMEDPAALISSATTEATEPSAGVWNFDFGNQTNFSSLLANKLDANGNTITPGVGAVFTAANGIFLKRSGDAYRYLVTKQVSANVLECNLNYAFDEDMGPGTSGNDDSYYHMSDDKLATFPAAGETCTVFIRGAEIDNSVAAGKLEQCSALAEMGFGTTGYQHKRVILVQPESLGTTVDGLEVIVPGYYGCAIEAARVGQYNPSQPFTNFPISGLTRPVGSSDFFNETQMATAAAGGVYWLVQDSPGAALVPRHQLTTDMTSLKTRELSVVKAVDYCAKFIRSALSPYIGRYNNTPGYRATLSLIVNSVLKTLINNVVAGASLDAIYIVEDALDEVAVDIDITPFYPANNIRVRILV